MKWVRVSLKGGTVVTVYAEQITYVQALGEQTRLVFNGGQAITIDCPEASFWALIKNAKPSESGG